MKKLVLLVMAVMMAALTYAENVTKEAALKKASLLKPGKKFMPAVEGNEKGYYHPDAIVPYGHRHRSAKEGVYS